MKRTMIWAREIPGENKGEFTFLPEFGLPTFISTQTGLVEVSSTRRVRVAAYRASVR